MMMESWLLSTTSSEEVLTAWFAETWAIDGDGVCTVTVWDVRPELGERPTLGD